MASREASVEVEPGVFALADADRLLQVLTNLVTNAIQHTPDAARLALRARRAEGQVLLEVADSGPGIPPEDLPHVFSRLYRGRTAPADSPGGAGLGLAIAASLVQAMGGEIAVRSAAEVGTTFTVRLPAVEAMA